MQISFFKPKGQISISSAIQEGQTSNFAQSLGVMFYARHIRASPVFLTAFHKSPSPFCRDHNYVAHAMTRAMKYSSTESLPRIAQPSFWQLLVPKFLRQSESKPSPARVQRSKQWNPATFFIVIFLFIGSNAIQMIALRTDFKNFSRKAEVKIGLLQDAIERLHRGEVVDVERLLGSGDEQQEREWEDGKMDFLGC